MYKLNDNQIEEIKNLAELDISMSNKNYNDHKTNIHSQHEIYDIVHNNTINYIKKYTNIDYNIDIIEPTAQLVFTGITGYDYNESILNEVSNIIDNLKAELKTNK